VVQEVQEVQGVTSVLRQDVRQERDVAEAVEDSHQEDSLLEEELVEAVDQSLLSAQSELLVMEEDRRHQLERYLRRCRLTLIRFHAWMLCQMVWVESLDQQLIPTPWISAELLLLTSPLMVLAAIIPAGLFQVCLMLYLVVLEACYRQEH
jgi:hypothetical protein